MKKLSTIVAAAALAAAFAAPVPGFARVIGDGAIYVTPDQSFSAKSLVGAPVFNDVHQQIGTIETVMVKAAGAEPMVVLSVGDYLGSGPKMVAVPLGHLQLDGKNAMLMAGATKSMLQSLPTYSIAGG